MTAIERLRQLVACWRADAVILTEDAKTCVVTDDQTYAIALTNQWLGQAYSRRLAAMQLESVIQAIEDDIIVEQAEEQERAKA
jgi:hypothetical protein